MTDYNFSERFLHRLALSNAIFKEISFDLEKKLFLKKSNPIEDDHVFIMGLARAGTTILLEAVYKSTQFASLSYLNMPFLLTPNLWGKVRKNPNTYEKVERAHGDGIMISPNSPEAFEEVFWKTFNKEEAEKNIENYIQLIVNSYSKKRYLSKNNQNITRISTIKKKFPNSKILVVFKNPLHHSASILRQHKAFIKLQKEDVFIKTYMDWIYHSEFGLSYKPITSLENILFKDYNHINHWLEQWYLLYSKILEKENGVFFIDGESLRPNNKSWGGVCKLLNLDEYDFQFRDTRKVDTKAFEGNQKLLNKCEILYKELQTLSI